MSEQSEGVKPGEQGHSKWWSRIFKGLDHTKSRPPQVVFQESDTSSLTPITPTPLVQEIKPASEIIEIPQDITEIQDSESLLQIGTGETSQEALAIKTLRPANKIFFHTTPTINVSSIREKGLMSTNRAGTIGNDLSYSIVFGVEFNERVVGRIRAIDKGEEKDFSMTIWKKTTDFQKANLSGFFRPVKELKPDEIIPEGYLDSRGGRRYPYSVEQRQSLRKIDSSNFLSSIPIDGKMQVMLTRSKIEFVFNLSDVESIETRLVEFLSNPDRQILFATNYTPQVLAHDLMARIQQEAIVNRTRYIAADLLNHIQSLDSLQNYNSFVGSRIGEIFLKLDYVNEPISYRYLKSWERKLKQAYKDKGLDWPDQKEITEDKQQDFGEYISINNYHLWGGTDGYRLARQVSKSMGLTFIP